MNCICGSNSFCMKAGKFICSYCKTPSGTKFSDLTPIDMNKKEYKDLIEKKLKEYILAIAG